jgi:uncharacterized protein YcfL
MKRLSMAAMLAALSLGLVGCGAMPHHAETRVTRTSSLAFDGSPIGASIMIDGVEVAQLDGKPSAVPIADGTHHVVVRADGRILYDRKLFIQDGTRKKITLSTEEFSGAI